MRDFMKNLIFTLSAILAGYLTAEDIFYSDEVEASIHTAEALPTVEIREKY